MALDLEARETSFDLIAPRGEELIDTFYARLFAAAPDGQDAVRLDHYPVVGRVLIASMAQVAADAWRPEYERAWAAAFAVVAAAMLDGAPSAQLGAAT